MIYILRHGVIRLVFHDTLAYESRDDSLSDIVYVYADYEQMVRSVMLKPCGMALDVLGYSRSLIREAVMKVLSENGKLDDSWITRMHILHCIIESCSYNYCNYNSRPMCTGWNVKFMNDKSSYFPRK